MQIFLKYFHIDSLDNQLEKFKKSATVIQKHIRGAQARRLAMKLREDKRKAVAATAIQAGNQLDTQCRDCYHCHSTQWLQLFVVG